MMVMPRLLEEVLDGLKARPEVEAVLLAGSRGAGGSPDRTSDWDLYVYLSSPLEVEARRTLLSPRSMVLELDNRFWEPEDDGELNDGTAFELIYRHLDDLTAGLARVVEKAEASIGYTTCFWHNLVSSHILFDRAGRLGAAQKRFSVPYPEALQRAIVAKNWPLLNKATPNFRDQVKKAVDRGDWVSVQHRTAAFLASAFDLVFAANGKTHPGEKRLLTLSCALPALPSDWANLLAGIDRAGQGSKANLPGALDALAGAMETFLLRRGLLEAPVKRAPSPKPPADIPPVPAAPPTSNAILTVYTDGGCIGNPGKGAWAYLVDDGTLRVEDTDGDPLTTNNKMELQAVIEALTAISRKADWKGRPIRIHTDSQYVRNGITSWIKTWSTNGWKTASKEPVKNQDLWMQLQKWDLALKPEWKWVKGHAGNPNNERCDQLVRRTMDQM
jgi:ribonuclease HI